MKPDTWPPAPIVSNPLAAAPVPPPVKPWAITAGTATMALMLAIDVMRHRTALAASFGVLLTLNAWAAVRAWRDYRRAVRIAPSPEDAQ